MRFVYLSAVLAGIILAGTAGYSLIEGWTLDEALYMTVISLTTAGYGEVHALSPAGRGFTIVLLLVGVGTVFYVMASVAEVMIEGRLRNILGRRKRVREINNLKEHHIVCGYGRIGFVICREFKQEGRPCLIIEIDHEKAAELNEEDYLVVQGDATSDDVLAEAGIERASSITCTLPTDAENVFVTLSARRMNPDLFIVSRAARESSIPKMEDAGANRVISPYTMGGLRMAESILRPKLAGFIDEITSYTTAEWDFEEARVSRKSALVGHSLRDSNISQETGVYFLAARHEGTMTFNPGADYIIREGDTLYAMGRPDQISSLRTRLQKDSTSSS
ncbi:MAG: NAD-binding protein [bacterium]